MTFAATVVVTSVAALILVCGVFPATVAVDASTTSSSTAPFFFLFVNVGFDKGVEIVVVHGCRLLERESGRG